MSSSRVFCKINLSIIFILATIPYVMYAQRVNNPSFEGNIAEGVPPAFWRNCGGFLSTPDTQPGVWDVKLPAEDGNTYIGLVFRERDNGSYESVTQQLNYPFHKDSCYSFQISLAFDPNYESPNSRQPGILKIWAGNNLCTTEENLWNSPVIDHKEWKTYIVSFSPSATYSSITLQGYFAGATFYYGDILIDNIRNIQAYQKPKLFIGKDTTICDNQPYTIDASVANGPFIWQDGSSDSSFTVRESGTYWVQAYLNGCKTSDTINITIEEPFQVELGPDIYLLEGKQTTLSLNIRNVTYKWNNQSSSSSITITETGKFWVEVVRGECIQRDTINVFKFFIPNIITPNADHSNDVFQILDEANDSWHLEIYNRMGKQVYLDTDYRNTWDGGKLTNGVYFYMLKSNTNGRTYKGPLTVLR